MKLNLWNENRGIINLKYTHNEDKNINLIKDEISVHLLKPNGFCRKPVFCDSNPKWKTWVVLPVLLLRVSQLADEVFTQMKLKL